MPFKAVFNSSPWRPHPASLQCAFLVSKKYAGYPGQNWIIILLSRRPQNLLLETSSISHAGNRILKKRKNCQILVTK